VSLRIGLIPSPASEKTPQVRSSSPTKSILALLSSLDLAKHARLLQPGADRASEAASRPLQHNTAQCSDRLSGCQYIIPSGSVLSILQCGDTPRCMCHVEQHMEQPAVILRHRMAVSVVSLPAHEIFRFRLVNTLHGQPAVFRDAPSVVNRPVWLGRVVLSWISRVCRSR
jgi:hypothetical protein